MTKKKIVSWEKPSKERVIITKIEILSDDLKRGWFPFKTLEPDEKWYGEFWINYEDLKDKKKILDLIFSDYIKTNLSSDGILMARVHLSNGEYYEHNFVSTIKK